MSTMLRRRWSAVFGAVILGAVVLNFAAGGIATAAIVTSQASLVDVSAFGAKFRLTARIPAGSWLMFNHHKAGISGRGTVRYCRMVKSSYEIGVHFSGGTGWNAASNPFGAHLRNLSGAIDRLQAVKSSARPAAVPDVAADK